MSRNNNFHNFDLNELPESPVNSMPKASRKEVKLKIRIGMQIVGERRIVKFHNFDLNKLPEKEVKLIIKVGKQLIGERMIIMNSKALTPLSAAHRVKENVRRENLKLKASAKIKSNRPSSSKPKLIAAEEKPPRILLKRNKAVQEKRQFPMVPKMVICPDQNKTREISEEPKCHCQRK